MNSDVNPATATAVRTWNKAKTTATVTVTVGEYSKKLGGRRAAQCSYALLYQRKDSGQWRVLGLRSEPKAEYDSYVVPITEQ